MILFFRPEALHFCWEFFGTPGLVDCGQIKERQEDLTMKNILGFSAYAGPGLTSLSPCPGMGRHETAALPALDRACFRERVEMTHREITL